MSSTLGAEWPRPGTRRLRSVNRLNRGINAGPESPLIRDKYADLGLNTFAVSPGEFGKLIADDVEKWKKVIKVAGIQPI